MANIVVGEGLADYAWIGDFFPWDLSVVSSSDTEIVIEDSTGSKAVFQGTGLSLDGLAFASGQISSIALIAGDDTPILTVTGSYKAKSLNSSDLWDFLSRLTAGNDTITGNDLGNDLGFGSNRGNDTFIAGDGGSFMAGSEGKDNHKGGADWDVLSYQFVHFEDDAKHGVTINAAKGTAIDAWGDKDEFSDIEEFRGSQFKDVIKGSKGDDAIMGLKGKDVMDGGKGWDELRYFRDDRYDGGDHGIKVNLADGIVTDGFGNKDTVKGFEAVLGTAHDDTFVGSDKNDQFRGLDGEDSFNGGKGWDTVSFFHWEDLGQHGVTVDLSQSSGQVVDDGFGNTETLKSIEEIQGSSLDDVITLGSKGGSASGDDGDDILTGGATGDWLSGGSGMDTFAFETASAISTPGADGAPTYIDDFSQDDSDQVDLSEIGGLSFIGQAAFDGTAGQLRYDIVDGNTFLRGDVDGDGEEDLTLEFGGAITLTADDFILA